MKKTLPTFTGRQRKLQYKIQIQLNEIYYAIQFYTMPCAIIA